MFDGGAPLPSAAATGFASHKRIVPSIAEAANRLPSALKARDVSLAKPAKVSIERPVLGSQILTVRSWLAVARRLPSALNARPTAKSVCA